MVWLMAIYSTLAIHCWGGTAGSDVTQDRKEQNRVTGEGAGSCTSTKLFSVFIISCEFLYAIIEVAS